MNGTVVQQYEKAVIYYPRKICVFSELARMFWSSEETTGDDPVTYLFSSTLAGTDVKPLYRVTADMVIQDLRVDHVDNRLYWLDRRDKLIYSMSVHGNSGLLIPYTSKYM